MSASLELSRQDWAENTHLGVAGDYKEIIIEVMGTDGTTPIFFAKFSMLLFEGERNPGYSIYTVKTRLSLSPSPLDHLEWGSHSPIPDDPSHPSGIPTRESWRQGTGRPGKSPKSSPRPGMSYPPVPAAQGAARGGPSRGRGPPAGAP